MRIALIVDGEAEYRSLPHLISRLITPHDVLRPLRADVQPFAPIPKIVGAVRRKLPIVARWDVDLLLLLVDRETRTDCPGELANAIQEALTAACNDQLGVAYGVVVKNRMYENWLIADDITLRDMAGRFALSDRVRSRIAPNRADNVDAHRLLREMAQRDAYSKVADAIRIMRRAEPERIAANSRSFRKMMRYLEHPAYTAQSRQPFRE